MKKTKETLQNQFFTSKNEEKEEKINRKREADIKVIDLESENVTKENKKKKLVIFCFLKKI